MPGGVYSSLGVFSATADQRQQETSAFFQPSLKECRSVRVEVFTDDGSPKAHGSSPGDDTRFADQNSPPSKDKTAAPQQEQDKQPAAVEGPVCPMPLQQRVYCDPQPQHWLEQAFAAVTLSIYLSWIHILLMLIVGSLFSTTLMYITIGIFSTLLLPTGPCLSPAFLRNRVWASWRRYLRFSVVFDEAISLAPGKRYVIPEAPHGVFPLGQLIATSLADQCWPGHPIYALAADAVFKVPLWRHVMTWLGGIPASAKSFRSALQKGSVGLVPGGIAEMFLRDPHCEIIKLKGRKGFVRLAVEAGADIVPSFHFGNSQLFRWGPSFLEPYARKHRVALGLLFGRWGLPFGVPNHVPIMFVVGKVVPVKKTAPTDPGFAAAVDDAHSRVMVEMQALYDKYKGLYGWQDRPLVIV